VKGVGSAIGELVIAGGLQDGRQGSLAEAARGGADGGGRRPALGGATQGAPEGGRRRPDWGQCRAVRFSRVATRARSDDQGEA
jgi:hypothetical protein